MDHEVHVWCIKLNEEPSTVAIAYSILSEDERERSARFRFPSLLSAFVLSRGILRLLLARFCDRAPSDLKFTYGQHGKPILADCGCPISFNMSHSDGIAACAITVGGEVGLDIERHRLLPDMEQIARRFFSPMEYRELMSLAELEREGAFFNCWVRKEAYIKALGGGLSIPLDSFQVSLVPGQPSTLVHVRDKRGEAREWSIQEFSPSLGYSGAVAFKDRRCLVRVHPIGSVNEMFQPTAWP
jgi:4'-phosphopantetheinyl transferase